MKHVKRVGMLLIVCALFASKEWNQKNIASIIKEDENNIEIIIENVHQQEHTRKSLVVHAMIENEEYISAKMMNECNENEL